VVFEPALRLAATLGDLEGALGNRQAVALRELTKLHEEIRPGTLQELRAWAAGSQLRGEVVLVIAGELEIDAPADDVEHVLQTLRRSGLSPSQAAREAAAITGWRRSDLYRLALQLADAPSVGLEGELTLSDENALQDALGNEESPE
jgi:16S rRNA (cytidine1402-2'-O)-methyltransferase